MDFLPKELEDIINDYTVSFETVDKYDKCIQQMKEELISYSVGYDLRGSPISKYTGKNRNVYIHMWDDIFTLDFMKDYTFTRIRTINNLTEITYHQIHIRFS